MVTKNSVIFIFSAIRVLRGYEMEGSIPIPPVSRKGFGLHSYLVPTFMAKDTAMKVARINRAY